MTHIRLLAAAMLCCLVTTAHADELNRKNLVIGRTGDFGSVAANASVVRTGTAVNMASQAEAEAAAKRLCETRAAGGPCHIVKSFRNSCVAVVGHRSDGDTPPGNIYVDTGPDLTPMLGHMVSSCMANAGPGGGRSCRVRAAQCSLAGRGAR